MLFRSKEIITFLQSQSRLLFEKTENELCFDYEVKSRDQTHQTISAVFAHQKEIQCTKKLFSQSKLKLTVIDIDAFALARLTHYSLNKHIFIYSDYDENCLIVIATAGKLMHCEYIKPASINHFLENSKEKYDYITPLPEAQNKSNYGDFSHKLLSIRSLLYPWFINKCAISSNQLSCFAIPIGLCLWEKHEH